jgi:hypothetical protein
LEVVGVGGVLAVEGTVGVDAAVWDLGVVLEEEEVAGVLGAFDVDGALVVVEGLGVGAFS